MPSASPWSLGYDFANDPSAANLVNAAALQAQLLQLAASLATLYTALGVPIRDDDTLTDALVRIRNLHPELSSYLTGTTLSAALTFLAPVSRATTGSVTLSGEQTIDGALTSASRVLVKDQAAQAQNGIYVTGAGAWARSTDLPAGLVSPPVGVQVAAGTVNANRVYALLAGAASVIIGTNNAAFFNLFPVATGPQGAAGAAGNTILSGTAAPTTEGVVGDFYLRATTSTLYGPKAAGGWPAGVSLVGPQGIQGLQGIVGVNGAAVRNGAIPPTTEGANGDFYIDTLLKNIHGPKAAGTWPVGASLVGPSGATGPAGTDAYKLTVLTGGGNWTSPAAGDWIIDASGGGGGGAGNNAGSTGGGSGGGGFRLRKKITVTSGQIVAYAVGAGGTAGAQYGNGGAGAATTFGTISAPAGLAGLSDGAVGVGDPYGSPNRGGRNPVGNAAGDPGTGQGGAGSAAGGTVGFAGASGDLTIQRVA